MTFSFHSKMRVPDFLVFLLIIIITSYTLLPLIYAYPQTLDNNLQETDLQYPLRIKRHIFDDIIKFGRSVANYGDGVLSYIKHSLDLRTHNIPYKDLERMCRNVKEQEKYDILCLENLGNSFIIANSAGKAIGIISDALDDKPRPKRTTTRKPWPTVNVDVIFILPTTTKSKSTTTPIPFDWPPFILNVVADVKASIEQFGTNVQSEMNRLVERFEDGEVAKSIINSAQGIERIGDGVQNVSHRVEDVAKSIDDVNVHIDQGVGTIEKAISDAASSIATPLDDGMKKIETSIDEAADSIKTSVNDSAVNIKQSIDEGVKTIEDALDRNMKSLESSLNISIGSLDNAGNATDSIQASIDKAAETIEKSLEGGIKSIETSVDLAAKSIGTSVENSATNIENTLNTSITSLETSVKSGADAIEKTLDTGIKTIETAILNSTDYIRTAIEESAEAGSNDARGIEDSIDKGMDKIEAALDKILDVLNMFAELLKKLPSEMSTALYEASNKIVDSIEQSEIFKIIKETLESIRGNQKHKLRLNRDILSTRIGRLADRILAKNNSSSIGLRIKEIAKEIRQIDTDKEDAVEILGTKLENLGTVFKEIDQNSPGIRTGQILKNIGTIMRVLRKYLLRNRFEE